MKIRKVFACVICAVVCITCMCGISVNAKSDYWFDVTDTEVNAGQAVELNSINEGLRQKINDTVQNYSGCTVTFKAKSTTFDTEIFSDGRKVSLIANGYFKTTVKTDSDYITFQWDELIPTHDKWGLISDIRLVSNEDFIITDIYIYVPKQDEPKLADLSAGACCYELTIPLE